MATANEPRESVVRFDLAVQKSHVFVYSAALVVSLIGRALGVFPLNLPSAIFCWVAASVIALLFHELYRRRRVPRMTLNPLWLATDVILCSTGVFATGGIDSPWYIWYLTAAAAAAFAVSKRAAYTVSIASAFSYILLLMLMGQAAPFNEVFLLSVTRMLLLFRAS